MKITKPNSKLVSGNIQLVASKSESNRALIIQALCDKIRIDNLSISDDTKTLKALLKSFKTSSVLDTNHAGTTFRFLTSFLSTQEGEWELTGSDRMKERPIGVLVDALNSSGGKIQYKEKTGFPPLLIKGSSIDLSNLNINGAISSQYISALLLIAPTLKKPSRINFTGKITSVPYIKMTLAIMSHFGAKTVWKDNQIFIENNGYQANNITIESDWSAVSYWFQIAALSDEASIEINGLKEDSFQGDSALVDIFKLLGVSCQYRAGSIHILKNDLKPIEKINLNLNNTPDIAQTIVCTCVGLGIEATITGLETLVIKETNRLIALQNELKKFDIELEIIENHTIYLKGDQKIMPPNNNIDTYNDHRMAMAFAPLCMVTDALTINNPEVVSKSYPNYWEELKSVGFNF